MHERLRTRPVLAVSAIALIVHFFQLHAAIARRLTFEDQTILWDAAHDLRQGIVHQVDFPGQFYGSALEAVPAPLFGAIGFGDASAFSLALLCIIMASWGSVAAALVRRGNPWLGAATLLLPIALTVDHSAATIMWVTAAPRTLAIIAVAVALGVRDDTWRWAGVIVLGGIGVLLDTSAALLVLPIVTWMFVEQRGRPPVRALLALAVPVVLLVGRAAHHGANPAFNMHPSPHFSLGGKPISWHFRNPTRTLSEYGPEALHSPVLRMAFVITVLVSISVLVARGGNLAARAAGAATVVSLALFFSSDGSLRSAETTDLVLSVGRGLRALPFLLLFLVAITAPKAVEPRRHFAIFVTVAILAGLGLGHRIATDASGDFAREFETAGALDVIDLDHLEATCVDLSDALEASQTTVALSWSPAVAYGCSVLMPSHQTVLFPRYDRRTWELERTLGITQTSWVVWGHGRDGCDFAPADGSVTCAIWADDVAVMTTPARAWNKMVHPLGMGVRPFPEGWPN